MTAWNVFIGDSIIDTVYYDTDCNAEYVRDGLINHDGYPSIIKVRKAR
jgi:hypothetical protein